jgi:hypothetical protein
MSDIAIKASEPIALKARLNEDWLAVVIGLLVYAAALVSISGTDLLGWAVTTSVYTDLARALAPVAKTYAWRRRRRAACDLCRAARPAERGRRGAGR